MLRVERLSIRLGAFSLRDISFTVNDGEYFVILGESGVGKTVLLEVIAGLATPDSGAIAWNDDDLTPVPIQRRKIGLVYQNQALFPHMTVRKNIAYGANGTDLDQIAAETGIRPLLDRYPETLSGGEMQRVALARTLACRPRCILLDEPLSALDQRSRGQLRALLRRIHKAGRTIVHVTHDFEEAVSLATRVAVMDVGTIVQVGTPENVFHHPRSEFVARFAGIRNVIRGNLARPDGATAEFNWNGKLTFKIATDAHSGPGLMLLRSEDITLSPEPSESSAQNVVHAKIVDILRVPGGMEVLMDAHGLDLAAMLTPESVSRLRLTSGAPVYAMFKATAARFLGDES